MWVMSAWRALCEENGPRSKQMKARAKKKTVKKSKATKTESMQTLASGAASVASLLGGAWAIASSDLARDLWGDLKLFRRRDDFGKSAGTWIAIGVRTA
jgi:hypothetical protein